jgi:hypothetical protein
MCWCRGHGHVQRYTKSHAGCAYGTLQLKAVHQLVQVLAPCSAAPSGRLSQGLATAQAWSQSSSSNRSSNNRSSSSSSSYRHSCTRDQGGGIASRVGKPAQSGPGPAAHLQVRTSRGDGQPVAEPRADGRQPCGIQHLGQLLPTCTAAWPSVTVLRYRTGRQPPLQNQHIAGQRPTASCFAARLS